MIAFYSGTMIDDLIALVVRVMADAETREIVTDYTELHDAHPQFDGIRAMWPEEMNHA